MIAPEIGMMISKLIEKISLSIVSIDGMAFHPLPFQDEIENDSSNDGDKIHNKRKYLKNCQN